MHLERFNDLMIKIEAITFTEKFIQIKSRGLHPPKMNFDSKISKKLNLEVVQELKIGMSYRITRNKLFRENGTFEFIWSDVECLNLGQQKARTLDGLFE